MQMAVESALPLPVAAFHRARHLGGWPAAFIQPPGGPRFAMRPHARPVQRAVTARLADALAALNYALRLRLPGTCFQLACAAQPGVVTTAKPSCHRRPAAAVFCAHSGSFIHSRSMPEYEPGYAPFITLKALTVLSCAPNLQNMNHNLLPPGYTPGGQVISACLCVFSIGADRTVTSPAVPCPRCTRGRSHDTGATRSVSTEPCSARFPRYSPG